MDKNIFNDLINLVELELSYNLLEDFPPELYANTKNLKELSLDNNQLRKFNAEPLKKLRLKKLRLEDNPDKFDIKPTNPKNGAGSSHLVFFHLPIVSLVCLLV